MEKAHIHRLVVIGEDRQTPIGVISASDLVRAMAAGDAMDELLAIHGSPRPRERRVTQWRSTPAARAGVDVLDMHAYVDDFNASVVDAYRRGVADGELRASRRRTKRDPARNGGHARLQRARAAIPELLRSRRASAA